MAGTTDSGAADEPGDAPGGVGEEAIRAALAEHGEDVAAAIERTDEVKEVVDLAILTIASADDGEVDHVTDSIANLVRAADGLSTEGSVALAEAVGESGGELTRALEMVVRLEREDKLDGLFELAEAVSGATVDEGAVAGLDRFAGAVSAAEEEAEPVGVLGFLRGVRSREGRAGLGYLLAILRALGREGRTSDASREGPAGDAEPR